MKTTARLVHGAAAILAIAVLGGAEGCSSDPGAGERADDVGSAWASDCPSSDQAGALVQKATAGTLYDARLSYRQTNDSGQHLTSACDFSTHAVTAQGMRDVPLHCSGKSQGQAGYARVAARWGTSMGSDACTTDYCAIIYVQDASGALHEAVRDVYLKDRFFCSQADDRTDLRLDVDACTYADVIGALKGTGISADDSNLTFDKRGKLAGYASKGLALKYRMYACASGPDGAIPPPPPPSGGAHGGGTSGGQGGSSHGGSTGGGGCTDVPPSGNSYSCAQQAGWGKCGESWMQGFCNRSCFRCGCSDVRPNGSAYSCGQQAVWGKCSQPWMSKGTCDRSCNRCGCDDIPPDAQSTCAQQKDWGKCSEQWMIDGDYCRHTCGRC